MYTEGIITIFSYTELMYRKHVQTVPTVTGIWLWESAQHFLRSTSWEYQWALPMQPISISEDLSVRIESILVLQSRVSNSFSPGVTSASPLPSKG